MATSPSVPIESPTSQYAAATASVSNRYNDAYRKANFQTGLGGTIKTLSLVIGGLVAGVNFLYFAASVSQPGMFGPNTVGIALGFFGMTIGVVIGGIGWIFGSMISSQGQLLKALLDTAVHTSPFLNNADRAQMMSL